MYKLVFTGNFSFQTNRQTDRQKESAGVELLKIKEKYFLMDYTAEQV